MREAPRLPSTLLPDVIVDPPGSARMWLPRLSLAQCIKCVMIRDTRILPGGLQRGPTYLPASPGCSLTWFLDGRVEQVPLHDPDGPALWRSSSQVVFSGPFQQPSAFRYPGPTHGLMVVILPDAFTALTGVDVSAWLNRCEDASDVVGHMDWLNDLIQQVLVAPDDDRRVALIEQAFDARWQATRPDSRQAGHLFEDWAMGLSLRAANTGLGRSLRQAERRIKQWTGQPLREFKGLGRTERAFFEAVLAQEQGAFNWAQVAESSGFADQSHLGRQTRRLTGFSPQELYRRIAEDDGCWAYRLWGFSEARPRR